MKEIFRQCDVQYGNFVQRCPRCNGLVALSYNGGELDVRECCGLKFALECMRIDYAIYEEK